MPTPTNLKLATSARDKFGPELQKLGAHMIGVEKQKRGWAVVAYFEDPGAHPIPSSLQLDVDGKTVTVPLVSSKAEKFKLE